MNQFVSFLLHYCLVARGLVYFSRELSSRSHHQKKLINWLINLFHKFQGKIHFNRKPTMDIDKTKTHRNGHCFMQNIYASGKKMHVIKEVTTYEPTKVSEVMVILLDVILIITCFVFLLLVFIVYDLLDQFKTRNHLLMFSHFCQCITKIKLMLAKKLSVEVLITFTHNLV